MDNERFKITKKCGIFGILGNIFLLILKAFVGFTFKSQAMIADSLNSAGDIFASLMTFIGNKIASVPNDEDHNFGHGKAEYIFSMFIAISMILVASKLLFDSFQTLILGSQLQFSWLLVVVCIITIITKFSLFLYTQKTTKKYSNILLESNMQDHRNDCIVTSFTLLSIILTLFGIHWFDSVVGIGISLWIAYTGITIFMESYNVLMDISVDEKTKNIIMDIIHTYSEIKKVDNISSTPIGSQYIIFITIGLDGNMPTFESHKLADSLEKDVSKLNNIYKTIVHVNPI
ncbi:cation diffusion facilitator family transporter [Clostridium sp. CAG:575]|nr:cation diffusion facilitator family transporter [Clostridium sp. CAG:575]